MLWYIIRYAESSSGDAIEENDFMITAVLDKQDTDSVRLIAKVKKYKLTHPRSFTVRYLDGRRRLHHGRQGGGGVGHADAEGETTRGHRHCCEHLQGDRVTSPVSQQSSTSSQVKRGKHRERKMSRWLSFWYLNFWVHQNMSGNYLSQLSIW